MGSTLLHKVWDLHTVRRLPNGQTQLFIGLHLVHEVTSPQAFDALRLRGQRVAFRDRTWATVDHIVPTDGQPRPFLDDMAEQMLAALERNCREFGVPLFDLAHENQGIVHVIGPELGLTQPGLTIACGDSHTSTHGAFGAVAFGIGTSQVRDVLASQCLAMEPLKVRRIEVAGALGPGVYAKDVILAIIRQLGVNGGVGFAYEYGGSVVDGMSMDERMTLCNMSIEGGARAGYVNPDATTVAYLRGRPYAPSGGAFDRASAWWLSMASDGDAAYDDEVRLDGGAIAPMVTWGINPGQSLGVDERVPVPANAAPEGRAGLTEALAFMGLDAGRPIAGTRIDVAFIGSCTNGRLSDLREAARVAKGKRVARHVRALVVPGSQRVRRAAEAEGLHEVFREAGFDWREAGCSMCLAMNPDWLSGREMCAASSNRNFKGRQGSPTGRTLLMSPAMVAAAAVAGEVVDIRGVLPAGGGAMSGQADPRVSCVTGRALPMPGQDIDTDRIMPARFLRAVSFDGLEAHVFEDDRLAAARQQSRHPFDDARYRGATVLVVGRNFGCGSSREHAPQALARWGIRAIVGESFAEIFFGNATALGVPCVTVSPDGARALAALVEADPALAVTVDLPARTVSAGGRAWPGAMAASAREALLTGTWDPTALLLADFDQVRAAASRLPYVAGF